MLRASCFLYRVGTLEYHCMTLEYNQITIYTNKTRDSSYLVEGIVATLGTRQGVLSDDEVETSMSMSMLWQVQQMNVAGVDCGWCRIEITKS